MSYGKSLAAIQSAFKTASPVVKQTTSAYTNGDSLEDVKDKITDVVGKEVVSDYGDDLSTVQAKSPKVGQSVIAFGGYVTVKKPTFEDNVVTIPEVTGITYVDGDTYDPEPEEGDPVVDVLTGTITLDDTDTTTLSVLAIADEGYKFKKNAVTSWTFEYVEAEEEEGEGE